MEPAPSAPRPLEEPPASGEPRLDALARLIAIVDRLRAPDGCPWDLEQTLESLAPSLIEEAHEAVEAIEEKGDGAVVEEAGDLLLVVVLIARIAQDEGRFDLCDLARGVGDKLVRRHPHVFGSAGAGSAAHVAENWERIKREERSRRQGDDSAVAGVPASMPALQRAHRIGAKVRAAGFRWRSPQGAFDKVEEELGELREAFETAGPEGSARGRPEVERELGDLLLAASQFAGYVGVDPEAALRGSLRRFEARFRDVEACLGEGLAEASEEQIVRAWTRAKGD